MDDTKLDTVPDTTGSPGAAAEFQPTVFGVGCYLSRKAEKLLKILRNLLRSSQKRGKTFVWPRQTKLATMMCCSRRTVQLAMDELVKAGLVVKSRGQGGNTYVLPDLNEQQLVPDAQNCASHAQNDGEFCASHAQNCASYYMTLKNDSRKDSSNNDPLAAADLFVPIEIQDASQQLQSLGLSAPLADQYAAKKPDLALAAVPFLQNRFTKPGIRNKTGFIRGVLDKPADYGFTRTASGRWQAPPIEVDPAAERGAKAAARRAADQEEARRAAEKAKAERAQVQRLIPHLMATLNPKVQTSVPGAAGERQPPEQPESPSA